MRYLSTPVRITVLSLAVSAQVYAQTDTAATPQASGQVLEKLI